MDSSTGVAAPVFVSASSEAVGRCSSLGADRCDECASLVTGLANRTSDAAALSNRRRTGGVADLVRQVSQRQQRAAKECPFYQSLRPRDSVTQEKSVINMDRRLSRLLLIVAVISWLFCSAEASLKPNAHQKNVLQNTVKALLDFKRLPRPGEVIRPVSRTADAASKYMRKLFDQYQQGGQLGHAEGNIVRSISPAVGTVNDQDALVFKLHTVKPNEQVIRAELHYNLRHKQHYRKKRQQVMVRSVARDGSKATLRPLKLSADWLSWDARDEVSSALRLHHDNSTQPELVLIFQRRQRSMHGASLLKHHTPFLLVFSDAPSVMDKQQVQSALYGDNSASPPDDDLSQNNRVKRDSSHYYSYSAQDNNKQQNEMDRVRMHVEAFQSTGPRILQSRKDIRQRRKHRRNRKQHKDELPYPEDHEFDSPADDDDETSSVSSTTSSDKSPDDVTVVLLGGQQYTQEKCSKRNLVVQFRDIGWEHWIIAPKSFEAHYCAGACPFPLEAEVNPSNHAIVQSIIHAIGLHPYVPQVCCAPDRMDSLTLLFFDEDDNVVLKNYPKMTVSSCGCL
uniref:TGF-beta family profile domain-containing protein n=1 Tax=Plectus sambesii TaxID=2011161 RepID=A0A914XVK7_9BILA